jgi:toxin ParE1/3/4
VTRKVQFTPPARAQFLAAVAYIRADKPSAAQGFRTLAFEALSRLIEFPDSGRVIPEYPRLGFREVLVGSHRFFYRVVGGTIWVVGVWHDAQIPEQPVAPSGG